MKFVPYEQLNPGYGIRYSRRRINQLEAIGRFPRRVKLNPGQQGAVAWIDKELDQYVADLIAQRDQAAE